MKSTVQFLNEAIDVLASTPLVVKNSRCSKGCSACCYMEVWIHPTEVAELIPHIGPEAWDRVPVEGASPKQRPGEPGWNVKPCPLLDEATKSCSVYENRPAVCRAYHVITPPVWCGGNQPGESVPGTVILADVRAAESTGQVASIAMPLQAYSDAVDHFFSGGNGARVNLVTALSQAKRALLKPGQPSRRARKSTPATLPLRNY